jgi:hypothetical protein
MLASRPASDTLMTIVSGLAHRRMAFTWRDVIDRCSFAAQVLV